jgi:hypothetical protein
VKLTFAYDKRFGPPHPIVPLIESGFAEKQGLLALTASARRNCAEKDIGTDTLEGEEAARLVGNFAPFGYVLDVKKMTWHPDKRELVTPYIPQEEAMAVNYKTGLDCDKVTP